MTSVLLATAYTVVAITGLLVVVTRDPVRQTIVNGFFGLALVLLFVILQAPDVAMSELVVSALAYPVILLVTIYRTRGGGDV
jgi:energy-converting hydrogenase B subunit D